MKKRLVCSLVTLFLLLFSGSAHADLKTIGTAQFGETGDHYNLIWDDVNNGNSVVWLDYTNAPTNWTAQNAWAAGLDSALTLYLNAGVSVNWDGSWRLPSTVDGLYSWGYDGTTTGGYNITSSEMGHLFYTELGNKGYVATDGTYPQPEWGLSNTGDFEYIVASWYWSDTEYALDPDNAWTFGRDGGHQDFCVKSSNGYGVAVRTGDVSVVPVPGALLLLGSGLVGLAGFSRRKGSRC